MDGGKGVFSIKEAARWLGVSVRTLYERTKAGLIDSYHEGRRRVYPEQALQAYVGSRLMQERQRRESDNGKSVE